MDSDLVLEILRVLFPAGIGALGTGGVIAFLLILFPEKVEKWQAIVWGWIEKAGLLYHRANKEKIRYSVQGHVSEFARDLGYELPQFNPPGIKIDWVEEATSRKAFIEDGKAVIRLRRNDPNNENIVTACLLFVSQILLRRSIRYLSPTQKESVELYVGYKMLERQPEEVFDIFVDKWLYPGIEKENKKVSVYFDRFRYIDQAQFFLPIFLQELVYMGDKVFGRKRDDTIFKEVDGALEFLELYASRKLGEKIDSPYFNGDACRFAIMIVGMMSNIDEERYDVYLKHIRERLVPCGVDTIYMLGPSRNIEFMRKIAKIVTDEFSNPFSKNYQVRLQTTDGQPIQATTHLSVLRRKQHVRYIS